MIQYAQNHLFCLSKGLLMHQNDKVTTIEELKDIVKQFVLDRDWRQFHSPKNLSVSLMLETAELMEKFQWLSLEESHTEMERNRQEIEHEIADVAVYLLNFCWQYNIDLSKAITTKMALNAQKYPVEKARGNADKYTHYKS